MNFWKWYLGFKWFPKCFFNSTMWKYVLSMCLCGISISFLTIGSIEFRQLSLWYLFLTIPLGITGIFYSIYWQWVKKDTKQGVNNAPN